MKSKLKLVRTFSRLTLWRTRLITLWLPLVFITYHLLICCKKKSTDNWAFNRVSPLLSTTYHILNEQCVVKLSVPCAQLLLGWENKSNTINHLTWPYCQLKCFSAFEGMRTADIIRQEIEDLERLLQGNPGLNVNCSITFSCLKMFFTSNFRCSFRLLQLKTEGQTI